jgi:hypothetical protein
MTRFNLGDIVVTKKLGPPQTGRVVGIHDGLTVFITNGNNKAPWFREYPDWIDHPVYDIRLNSPSRNTSFEEFVAGFNIGMVEGILNGDQIRDFLSTQYVLQCHLYYYVSNPEEDLEIL